jgi:hypothetical protein
VDWAARYSACKLGASRLPGQPLPPWWGNTGTVGAGYEEMTSSRGEGVGGSLPDRSG